MPKKFIQRFMPDPRKISGSSAVRLFGKLAHNTNLWHLNRRTAAGAFAVGLFYAFMPMPFQMVAAAATAILLRVNLPLSVALVWISNPITMPAMLYASYQVGALLLNQRTQYFNFELTWVWFQSSVTSVLPALLLGSIVLGTLVAIIGYSTIRILWRQAVRSAWRERIQRRIEKRRENNRPNDTH